jgi:hypothetical protein
MSVATASLRQNTHTAESARQDPLPALRLLVILGLLSTALIHLLDLPGTLTTAPVQGVLFLVLMADCLLAGFLLLHAATPWRWALAGAIAVSALTGYVLTRTVGLPFDQSDIGNWGDPLGIASLFVEGVVAVASGYGLWLTGHLTDDLSPLAYQGAHK